MEFDFFKLKIVLTIFTLINPEKEAWAKSASDTIMRIIFESWFSKSLMAKSLTWFPLLGRFIKLKTLGKLTFERTAVGGIFYQSFRLKLRIGFHVDIPENRVQHYEDWEEYVKANVPADRLLVFNAKEGWEPLCKFLGKEVPDGPYPRAPNTSANMSKSKNF